MKRKPTLQDQLQQLRSELNRERKHRKSIEAKLRTIADGPDAKAEQVLAPYPRMIGAIRDAVRKHVPQHATLLVVSKGDPALVKFKNRSGWHFPQMADGTYAGHYPANKAEAVRQIERLRMKGADYLVFPATSRWWLQHYDLDRYLGRLYRRIHDDDSSGVIFSLGEASRWEPLAKLVSRFIADEGRTPSILNCLGDAALAATFNDCNVFSPPVAGEATLPYVDGTIDIVVLGTRERRRINEARRVAAHAVVVLDEGSSLKFRIKAAAAPARAVVPDRRSGAHKPFLQKTAAQAEPAGHILVCSHYLPQPDLDSFSRRLFHFVQFLTRAGWSVSCIAKSPARFDQTVPLLTGLGAQVHAGFEETVERLVTTTPFDAALLGFWHIARPAIEILNRCSPSTATIVDSGDLHFLRQARRMLRDNGGMRNLECLGAGFGEEMVAELNVYSAADAVFAVSQKEAEWLRDFTADAVRSHFVPDSEEMARSTIPFAERRGIVFVGNFEHAPNVEAMDFLCNEVLRQFDPKMLAAHPVYIVGNAVPEKVVSWASSLPFVRLAGWVPSVAPYLERARVSIVPLLHGAGTKRKMIQALAIGTPTVSTSVGVEGFSLTDGEEVLIADDPVTFANAIARLLDDEGLWTRIARQGQARMRAQHSREAAEARLLGAVRSVIDARRHQSEMPALSASRGRKERLEYAAVVRQTREAIAAAAPAGSRLLVVSKGDSSLLNVGRREISHFPQGPGGTYAGYYPGSSADAIQHLEQLRERGAQFLVFPGTALWWLDHYADFKRHLESRYNKVTDANAGCLIFSLQATAEARAAGVPAAVVPAAEPVLERPRILELAEHPSLTLRRPAAVDLNGLGRPRANGDAIRVLVAGVYLTDRPNNIADIVRILGQSSSCQVVQRWAALGSEPPAGRLAEVTVRTYRNKTPKFEIINDLLGDEKRLKFDYILLCDDDIVMPHGFLDQFIALQSKLGFSIAQPAMTSNSYVNHPIVEQQHGVFARETRFVEIGPLVSFHRSVLPLVLPFDLTSPMGWGYEQVWAARLAAAGKTMGIIDALPVDHSMRPSVSNYSWHEANRQREEFLAQQPSLPYSQDDLYRVLSVAGPQMPSRNGAHNGQRILKAAAQPKISVVIPTYNRAALLDDCLESLARQTLATNEFEVIVVNDGAFAATAEVCAKWASRLRLAHLSMQQSGIASAKNLGVFAAASPIILFFDDDDIADENLLAEHLRVHARCPLQNVAVLGYTEWAPALEINDVMRFVTDIGNFLFSYTRLKDRQRLDFRYFWGGRASCKKVLLAKGGVFRQEFTFGSEDIELAFRLSKLLVEWQVTHRRFVVDEADEELRYQVATVGLNVIFNRQAVQYMNRAITYDEFCRRCERQGRSQLQFSRLHKDALVQDYCQAPKALERWTEVRELLPGKVQRVHEIEAALRRANGLADRAALLKELHALYYLTFDAFKLKGIAEAMTGQQTPAPTPAAPVVKRAKAAVHAAGF